MRSSLTVEARCPPNHDSLTLVPADKSHFREFFTYTYLNFSMWSQTASSVQEKLLSQITIRVKAAPQVRDTRAHARARSSPAITHTRRFTPSQYFRKVIGVQRIVDALCDLDFAQNRIALLQLIGESLSLSLCLPSSVW